MKAQIADIVLATVAAEGARLSPLCDCTATFEGWWKAEIALALRGRFFKTNNSGLCARVESKPNWAQLCDSLKKDRFDVTVIPFDPHANQPDYSAAPRVWLNLMERSTWWDGGARKALLETGRSIDTDLRKGREINWTEHDLAAAVQITWCPDTEDARELPAQWEAVLTELASRYGRWARPLRKCFPRGDGRFNLGGCDIFSIHDGDASEE